MINIKVKLRESTVENKRGTVYYQLSGHSENKQITTQYKIYKHEWDFIRSLVIIANAEYQRRYDLQLIENAIIRDITQLKRIIVENDNVDDVFHHFRKMQRESCFSVFGTRVAGDLKSNGQVRTSNSYLTSMRSFMRFRDGKEVTIEELDFKLVKEYEKYLKEQKVCNNTISFYMRNLRAIYNRAVEENYTEQRSPFRKVYVGNDKTTKRAIDGKVIRELRKLDLFSKPWLEKARDLFMFCFYTRGMAFVDAAHLTKENLRGDYIVYQRHKTGQELCIKLEPRIKAILKRYATQTYSNYLLPVLVDKTTSYDSALRLHNLRLKEISKIMNLETPLTSYVARHSWATLAKKKGISTQIISESMGHNNEKTTQIYLSSLDRSVIDEANAKLLSEI